MEKKNSSRLTAVQKNVSETNRRLQDMQNMLSTFLSSLTGTPIRADPASTSTNNVVGGGCEHHTGEETPNQENQVGLAGSSEDWWKKLEKSSEDDKEDGNRDDLRMKSKTITHCQVNEFVDPIYLISLHLYFTRNLGFVFEELQLV